MRLRWTGALARAELVDALERELAVLPVSGSTVTVPIDAAIATVRLILAPATAS